jgi:3-oxoacyl-(acyl-carrier-protein) synthase
MFPSATRARVAHERLMRALSDRDAVIVGVGAVTAAGHGLDATWNALAAGRTAAAPGAFAQEPFLRTAVPEELESQSKFLNGAGRLSAEVVARAVAEARLSDAGHADAEKGLYFAAIDLTVTSYEGYRAAMEDATDRFTHPPPMEALNVAAQRRMNPFYLLETLNNNAFSFLSAWHGLRGANTSLSGWSGPGLHVVALAARAVSRGDASACVACAASRLASAVTRMEMERLSILPAGVVGGEGAAAVVLEPVAAARARHSSLVAAVVGSGAAFGGSAGRPGSGERRGSAVRAAVDAACAEAGLSSREVGSIWARSLPPSSLDSERRPVFSTTRCTGEMGPASDLLDVTLAARALARGTLPDGRPAGASALVVAVGLEGQTVAIVLGRAD